MPFQVQTSEGAQRDGPPGVGVDITSSGFQDCKTVYFFIDGGAQIGSAKPDSQGVVRAKGLSIPGGTDPGDHTITASCERSGKNVRFSTTFRVTNASVHRSGLITAIPQPRDISRTPRQLALAALAALAMIPLLAFPFQLFNSTLEENYDEVRGWFHLQPRTYERLHARRQAVELTVLLAAAGILYGALSPDFGLNRTTAIICVALSAAVLTTGAGFSLPTLVLVRERLNEWGRLRVLPGTILIAAFTVGISRLLHFQPGYVYGLIAAFVYRRNLEERTEGRVTALSCVIILGLTMAAWFLRTPVTAEASKPHPAVIMIILEAFLGGVFLMGLESLLVDLLPMRFLDGSRVIKWSRAAWVTLFAVGMFALIDILLVPSSGYVAHTKGYSFLIVMILYVAFGIASVSFWAYFRFRKPRGVAAP